MPRKRSQPFDNLPSKRQNLRPRRKETKSELTPSKLNDIASKQQSLQHVKDEISSLIKYNSSSPRNFSANVVLTDAELSKFPLIEIENYGILPSLLTKPTFDDVKNHLLTSSDGASDSVAPTNNNSLELPSDKFKLQNTLFPDQVCHLFNGKVKSELELDNEANVFGKLLKLVINGPGGRIEDYTSINDNDDLSFGTVIIQLPSFFTGGNMVVSHIEKRKVYTVSGTSNNPSCSLVAYYSNCSVQQEEVTSGYQTLLIYSLCWDGNGAKPSAYNEVPIVAKFRDALESLMFAHNKDFFVWALDSRHKIEPKTRNILEFLGTDKKLTDLLKKALTLDEQQYNDKARYHLYVGNAVKTIEMKGVCGGRSLQCDVPYGEDCGGSDFKIKCSDFMLCSFKPLTKATLKLQWSTRSRAVDAKNLGGVIDNYKDHDENSFWGSCARLYYGGCGGTKNSDNILVATKTKEYKRSVLLLWRADCAFETQCSSGGLIHAHHGIYHILQLINKGQLEEAENKLETIYWPLICKDKKSGVPFQHCFSVNLLMVCYKLNKEDKLLMLFKEFPEDIRVYIYQPMTLNSKFIVGKIIKKFPSDAMIEEFINILKICPRMYVKQILLLCKETQVLEPKRVIEIMTNFVFRNYSLSHICTEKEIFQLFEYMILTNTYPDQEVNTAMEFVDTVTTACFIIEHLLTKDCTPIFNKIVLRYVYLLVQEYPKPNWYRIFTNSATIIKCLLQHQKKESIDVLLAKLLPTVDTAIDMLCMIEVHKSINVEDRIVIKTLAARLTELVIA